MAVLETMILSAAWWVGKQSGSITASYATGNADGGAGVQDSVGGLVGRQFGSISASYSFGSKVGGEFAFGH